jgi:hypothetical protein
VTADEVQVLAARARIRVLTAAVDHGGAQAGDAAPAL